MWGLKLEEFTEYCRDGRLRLLLWVGDFQQEFGSSTKHAKLSLIQRKDPSLGKAQSGRPQGGRCSAVGRAPCGLVQLLGFAC